MRATAAVVLLSLSHYLPTQLCVYHLEFSVSVRERERVSVFVCSFPCVIVTCFYEGDAMRGKRERERRAYLRDIIPVDA